MAMQIANTRAKEVNQRQFGESGQRTKSVASNEKRPKKLIRGSCGGGQRSQPEAVVGSCQRTKSVARNEKRPKKLIRGSCGKGQRSQSEAVVGKAKEVNQRQLWESCQRTEPVASRGKKPKELTSGSWGKVAKELSQWQARGGNQRS